MRLMRAFIPALLVLAMLAAPTPSQSAVSVGISVGIAPPPLPVYEQPPIPGPGYLWTPGYWAWGGPVGYYWVPGTWVFPPTIGFLWTPPWWGWGDGGYFWHAGYWGPHIGFYGGINYGFGYFGHGYDGGYWEHGRFFYNREVNNIRNVNITNVYSRPVENRGENRVAFSGGNGGVTAQPTAQEQAALRERHIGPTALQTQHFNAARTNPDLRAATTNGQPKILATPRAGRFTNTGAVTTAGPGVTGGRNFQHNVRPTNIGPTGPKGVTSGGPSGTHRTFQPNRGPTGLQGGKGPGGTPHVMGQTVHPAGHAPQGHAPQGHPPAPGGKNPKTPG